jgi:nickel/cobalt transporter (NiCoT) family protein
MLKFLKLETLRESGSLRLRIAVLYAALLAFNIGAWLWALIAFHDYPLLLGTSLLAYSFGLRHAVDADHIAAIDNVTRKLMQTGKRPISIGLMFALGHSTIVVLASVGIAATAMALEGRFAEFKEIGGLIGTVVSTLFLFAIATMNLFILRSIVRAFQRVRRGEPCSDDEINGLISDRGFLARIFRPLFGLVTKSSHMYLLGFLFGLGFDTATEVGLLGMSAAATQGMPIWSILVFPILFTAGMTLIDTTDSILMLGAYGWAFAKPIRKLYYNMTITTLSIVVAFLVGSIEGLGLLADRVELHGTFWNAIGRLNDNFGTVGYVIVGIFVLSWVISTAVYKSKHVEKAEAPIDSI